MIEPTQCHLWTDEEALAPEGFAKNFDLVERFYDSSHLMYALLSCKKCGQRYYNEFLEEIDWDDGNDPTYLTYIPVGCDADVASLRTMSSAELQNVTPRLLKDWPSSANEPKIRWMK